MAVGVMGLVLVGMVVAVTMGIKTTRVAKERLGARHLIESRLEEVRRERDVDPEGFFQQGGRVEGPRQVGTNPVYSVTTTYVEMIAGEQYEILVEVGWVDGANNYEANGGTILSNWVTR